jgi:hypothetical protein
MATVKTAIITQLDNAPFWPGSPKDIFARAAISRQFTSKTTSGAGSATNDLFRMMRLWTGWQMPLLWFESEAWGASGSIDIGFYDINDGAIIGSGNQIASGMSVVAAQALQDVRVKNASNLSARYDTIGAQLGLTTDKFVDLVVKAANIGASQAAKFGFVAEFG